MKKNQLIGREKEIQQLESYCSSGKSEFIAVYGRRRVGKTFLIDQFFNQQYDFYMTGMYGATNRELLTHFSQRMAIHTGKVYPVPANWMDAFFQLQVYLQTLSRKRKIIVFIDELPWFDVPYSRFLKAFELFWNNWASKQNNLKLVICGSATSWMTNKVLGNKGGLHNRVTHSMHLSPFNLYETELFLKSRGFAFGRKQVLETYMVLGGTPYYLDMMNKTLSVAQNIDVLFFQDSSPLKDEYGFLFKSLFNDSDLYKKVVSTLASKNKGLSKHEIIESAGMIDNGYLTEILDNLRKCDFVRCYNAFGKKERDRLYQLTDLYSLFYLRFVKDFSGEDGEHWEHMIDATASWRGYAFEQVCLHHIPQIKKKLGISGIQTEISSWSCKSFVDADETEWQGGQIDLLIDRKDSVINLCEMKYSDGMFTITKAYDKLITNRRESFRHVTNTRKALYLTLVTTEGVTRNSYWNNIQSEVIVDDLFEKE